MKRFEFSLERVLKVKRQLERQLELEQQRAKAGVDRAVASRQLVHDQLSGISDRFVAAIGSTMTPDRWLAAADMTERLGESLQQADRGVAEAERQLLVVSQKRAHLASEVEALATLRRQQWEQWRHESHKYEQSQLDEVGLRRWMDAHSKSSDSTQATS